MSLETVIKQINKDFKRECVQEGIFLEEVTRIPFTSPTLNYATYGGVPIGRIIEFSGMEGGGKSTMSMAVCGQAQKLFPDKKVLYVDVEQTFDPIWAQKAGLNTDTILMYCPPEGIGAERIFQDVKDLIETGDISVCVIDSLGALVSNQAYSKTLEDRTYGGIAMPLTNFSKQIAPICTRTGCTIIGINQIRENLNSPYGGTMTPGGKGWKHACSLRIEFRKGSFVDEKGNTVSNSVENPCGHIIEFNVQKSKVGRLDRKVGKILLNYLDGIDYVNDYLELGVKDGKILVAGAWYSIVDTETGEVLKNGEELLKFQGKANIVKYLKEHPETLKLLQ